MRLPDEYDKEPKMSVSAVYAILGVTLFVAAVLVLVLVLNSRDGGRGVAAPSRPVSGTGTGQGQSGEEAAVSAGDPAGGKEDPVTAGSGLRPGDFDFWDLYPEETEEEPERKDDDAGEEVSDPATDGKHTKITYADGREEWVLISPYLAKNEYDFTKLVCQSDLMKYYEDGKKVSYVGADISKYQDYVDFVKLKKAGVDFVMLRVGSRGYGTGQLTLDDYFLDNIKRATDAGLQVGVYFFSQAVTEDEAVEEAGMVLENIRDYPVSYPVAFDMEYIDNDTSRIDGLTRNQKTKIAKKFLDTIKAGGYIPMLYGDKGWLIRQVDLSKLNDYDIWLSQPGDLPDYPYKFSMWQYSVTSTIDGIAGYANLNISFIDYSEK